MSDSTHSLNVLPKNKIQKQKKKKKKIEEGGQLKEMKKAEEIWIDNQCIEMETCLDTNNTKKANRLVILSYLTDPTTT